MKAEDVSPSVRDAANRLAGAGLLTQKQALAYVLREIEGVPREDAAGKMGVSPSTLDGHLGTARKRVGQARATIDAVEDLGA